jgi:nuclear migration protein JNM1
VLGDISDEEDGESLERKLARLRREIEEVKEEFGKRSYEKQKVNGMSDDVEGLGGEDEAVTLSKMLDSISVSHGSTKGSAGVRLAKSLGSSIKSSEPQTTIIPQKGGEAATYTVTYAPDYQQSHTFARAADFDSRLTLLEKALGITSIAIPALDSKGVPMAVLPTLDRLQRQITVITEASPSSLDSISRRVRTLTQEAERLDEARKSAKAAQEELRAANGDASAKAGGSEDAGDPEQVAKINALYGTLGTIENLAPILPSLLDRLRSLRAIHTDAATASETLQRVAKRQEDMAVDIKKWREGLEKVEQAMKQSETVMGGNMKVVEGWVKDLEERMARF